MTHAAGLLLGLNGVACTHDRPVFYPHGDDRFVTVRDGSEGRIGTPSVDLHVQGRDEDRPSRPDDRWPAGR
jgi:hypothetical protein